MKEQPTAESEEQPTEAKPTGQLTFEDFERTWPAIVATIRQDVGPRRHALLKEASPVGMEDGTIVFEVAAHMHFHLEQLKADTGIAEAISAASRDQLGQEVRVSFRSAEGHRAAPESEAEPQRAPDRDDLVEATDDGADVVSNVLDVLGGEIVGD